MRYEMNRAGIGQMMKTSPQLKRTLLKVANEKLSMARARAPRSKPGDGGNSGMGTLAGSGRVDDLGIKPVFRGEPRMTVAVVFETEYAAINNARTGFLSSVLGRPVAEPPDLPGGGR